MDTVIDLCNDFLNDDDFDEDMAKSLAEYEESNFNTTRINTNNAGASAARRETESDFPDSDLDLANSFTEEDEQELIAKSCTIQDVDAPSKEHYDVLQKCFGHKSFRPMQWKIINSIINDRRDNCAVMATGYGKSLCYQYPSVFCGGITIVISPLISLMEDQVLSLKMSNIPACLLGTAQTQQKQVIEDILEDKYSLVYLTPEYISGDFGSNLLKEMDSKLSIILIAIDEAHCVSTWGHDFRHQYRELGILRNILPHVPILAVTATATQRVRNDIIVSLKLINAQVLCSGFDRPNLYLSVFLKGNMGISADLKRAMIKQDNNFVFNGSTIIYCITRKQTEDVADILKSCIQCAPYHAGMPIKQRKETHEQFVRDKINVIVATIAFGMGIDKPDVRNVIHYGCSRDIESYYQEVGRAGRDGQPAKCITFYNSSDFDMHRTLRDLSYASEKNKTQKENMAKLMQKYLESRGCRRKFILEHFEGQSSNNQTKPNCCDNCTKKLEEKAPEQYEGLDDKGFYNFTEDAHTFLAAVDAMNGKFGLGMYILFLRGSKSSKIFNSYQKHPLHGSGKHKSEDWWKGIARILEREKYLGKTMMKKDKFSCHTVNLSKKGEKFLENVVSKSKSTKILLEPTPEIFLLLKRKPPPEPAFIAPSISSLNLKPPLANAGTWLQKKQSTQTSETSNGKGTGETDKEKEERMKVYRMLMNKRTELASYLDCMPYMIASNEALMKMAQLKPRSVLELRSCQLEGFTEAKILKFGATFVQTILLLHPKTVEDILLENPLPKAKLAPSAEITYNLYKNGASVQEIIKQRNMASGTITSHLCDCIKLGKNVKLKDLSVTEEIKNIIVNVIRNPPINSDMQVLMPIKNLCPPEITFDQVNAVMAYLEVRDHLKLLNCEYEDFEPEPTSLNAEGLDDEGEYNVALNALVDEIEKQGYIKTVEPPQKKQKIDELSLLDEVFT